MPRDGSQIYHRPPGTDGIPDTTIESTKYNINVADVEQDLNLPRPIVAGGTGANNAHDAMVALQGEINAAAQHVDNYNTFPFVSGSFYSAPGATGAPNGNQFYGTCINANATDPSYMMLIAYQLGSVALGSYFIREKIANVWGAWTTIPSPTDLNNAKVNRAGDTMTGNLLIQKSGPTLQLNRTDTGPAQIFGNSSSGYQRWAMWLGDNGAESGGNAGSDFFLHRYADNGPYLGAALSIARSNGSAAFRGVAFSTTANTVGFGDGNGSGVPLVISYNGSIGTNGGAHIQWMKGGASKWVEGFQSSIFGGTLDNWCLFNGVTGQSAQVFDISNNAVSFNGPATFTAAVTINGVTSLSTTNIYAPLTVAYPGWHTFGRGGTTDPSPTTININGSTSTGGGACIQLQKNGITHWTVGHRSAVYGSGNNNLVFYGGTAGNTLELDAANRGANFGGQITVTNSGPYITLQKTDGNQAVIHTAGANGYERWAIWLGTADAESGGNAGCDFAIYRYADTGGYLGQAFRVSRATGAMDFGGNGTFDGTLFVNGGRIMSRTLPNSSVGCWNGGGNAMGMWCDASNMYLGNMTDTGTPATYALLVSTGGILQTPHTLTYKPGGGAWNDSSDIRIKNVLGDYESGLDEILALQPKRFTFKGNDTPADTPPSNDAVPQYDDDGKVKENKSAPVLPYANSPHHHPAEDKQEFVGLIAQEAQPVMPEMVTTRAGMIDGVAVDDLHDINTTPLVYALINAVKTLAARVEELEARQPARR